jgi:RND family efflux transporter MFP subunit
MSLESNTPNTAPERRSGSRLVGAGLVLVVLIVGVVTAVALVKSSPRVRPQMPPAQATLVETKPGSISTQSVSIQAMGTVTPSQQIDLRPRVSGEILEISDDFLPGGYFTEGELILQIDPADYELAVRQMRKNVADAHTEIKLEEGNQTVVQKDLELLGEVVAEEDLELVLRQPQLARARASVDAAEAQLNRTKLDLERTSITAPFNSIIQSRSVNIGTQVGPSNPLATLVGTDTYWIEVSVPVDKLKWIQIPRASGGMGSKVTITDDAAWPAGTSRTGHVFRLAADLEPEGRMAKLIVSVEDPLSLKAGNANLPRLLLGSFVRAVIEGSELKDSVGLDRQFVRDGNTVWIMSEEKTLDIRPVEIGFRGHSDVIITGGLQAGERIITSQIASPVADMPLRTADDPQPPAPPRGEGGKW